MTDLPVEEREAREMAYEEWSLAGAPIRDAFHAGWSAAREYSKQRDEELRDRARELIDAHDDWSVNCYPSDGGPAIAARAWFDEAQRVEDAVENLRAALAENGDTGSGRCGRVMVGYGEEKLRRDRDEPGHLLAELLWAVKQARGFITDTDLERVYRAEERAETELAYKRRTLAENKDLVPDGLGDRRLGA